METLVLISMLLAVLGIGLSTWRRKELPRSVSAMVYNLPVSEQYIWTLWLWVTAFLCVPSLMESIREPWTFVGFFWIAAVMFCGAMPLTERDTEKWHDLLGLAAGILSQCCVWLVCPWWLLLWTVLLVLAGILITGYDKPWVQRLDGVLAGKGVFVAEVCCAVDLYGCLIVN